MYLNICISLKQNISLLEYITIKDDRLVCKQLAREGYTPLKGTLQGTG
jgi:hypothetical protein